MAAPIKFNLRVFSKIRVTLQVNYMKEADCALVEYLGIILVLVNLLIADITSLMVDLLQPFL